MLMWIPLFHGRSIHDCGFANHKLHPTEIGTCFQSRLFHWRTFLVPHPMPFPIIHSFEKLMTDVAASSIKSLCKLDVQGVAFLSTMFVEIFICLEPAAAILDRTEIFARDRLNEAWLAQ